jgi:hypothetical protein
MAQAAISSSVYPITVQSLRFYRIGAFDTYPRLTHAIFTRRGGYSQRPFHSLNLGASVGDDPEAVKKNFEQVCQVVNITPAQTVSCHLIHSAHILTIDQTNQQRLMGKGDGLVTAEPDIYLAMRFGDCAPLIFFDPVRGAVGLTHAGWRGTIQNVAGETVRTMVQQLGCYPANIMAVIGPAIGPCCYEVGAEVMAAAAGCFGDTSGLFIHRNGSADQAHFDLWEANRRQLAAAGVRHIIQSGLCTACRTDEFFSHRAEHGQTGRFGVMIGLRGGVA